MANQPYGKIGAAFCPPNNDLGTRILNTFQLSQFPTGSIAQEFTPENALDGIITPSSVIQELTGPEGYPPAQDPVINFIVNRGKKLFATSIRVHLKGIRLYHAMCRFMKYGITDENLPLADPDKRTQGGYEMQQPGWEQSFGPVELHDFMKKQWCFLAPSFKHRFPGHQLTLHPQHIFPFIKATEKDEGGFGKVYEVTIHRSHMAPWFESDKV